MEQLKKSEIELSQKLHKMFRKFAQNSQMPNLPQSNIVCNFLVSLKREIAENDRNQTSPLPASHKFNLTLKKINKK